MTISKPRSGYTLPVFACAASVAALHWLQHQKTIQSVLIDLIDPSAMVEIAIEQISGLKEGMALAIAKSDPGDNLDLTSNTPVWALVEWRRAGELGVPTKWGLGAAGEAEEEKLVLFLAFSFEPLFNRHLQFINFT